MSVADVARVRVRQRELEIPESFEWVAETTPALRAAVEESGLAVHEHPLMLLDPGSSAPAVDEMSEDLSARTLDPDNPALPSALAVPHLAFAEPGTRIGSAGAAELAETVRDRSGDGSVDRVVARIRAGLTVVAAAVEDGTALCAGGISQSGRSVRSSVSGRCPPLAVVALGSRSLRRLWPTRDHEAWKPSSCLQVTRTSPGSMPDSACGVSRPH